MIGSNLYRQKTVVTQVAGALSSSMQSNAEMLPQIWTKPLFCKYLPNLYSFDVIQPELLSVSLCKLLLNEQMFKHLRWQSGTYQNSEILQFSSCDIRTTISLVQWVCETVEPLASGWCFVCRPDWMGRTFDSSFCWETLKHKHTRTHTKDHLFFMCRQRKLFLSLVRLENVSDQNAYCHTRSSRIPCT